MDKQLITPDSVMEKSSNWKTFLSEPQLQLWRLKAEKARRSLKQFVMQAWGILEPETKFVDGLHMDAICSHLQAVTEGRIGKPHHQRAARSCEIDPDRGDVACMDVDRPSGVQMVVQ